MSGHFDEQVDDQVSKQPGQAISYQCWICPHCFDDRYHHSDAHGCERHAEQGIGDRVLIGPTDI